MKRPRLTKLINTYIKPEFAGYRQKGRDFFKEPLEYILRGYAFDSGSGADMLNINVFAKPLYAPGNPYSMGVGDRILATEVTASNEASAMAEVVQAMKSVERRVDQFADPESLAQYGFDLQRQMASVGLPLDAYEQEMIGYSLILAGDYRGAEASLKAFRAHLARTIPQAPHASWLPEMDARAAKLLEALRQDPRLSVAMLNDWTAETKAILNALSQELLWKEPA